ncbi:RNA ligase family protein [Nocardia goodfellowii]
MNFDKPKNENYAAVITTVKAVLDLPKRDRIVGLPLYGHQAIASKGWTVGDLGVFIPAEAQLSHEYASHNNMYRHENLNRNPGEKGYLEDNRRVKAIKLGGHTSNALFMPLSSLDFTGVDISKLEPGDMFDSINGIEIVRKYEIRPAKEPNNQAPKPRKSRVDTRLFPEHVSTANYWRMLHSIDPDDFLYVTQKLHGTSVRVANIPVARKLTWRDRFGRFIGAQIRETEYDMVYGSRRVIKDANAADQNHFYSSDIWTLEGKKLDGIIPSGYMVFGELVGWTPDGSPIQKGYTYQVPERQARLYIYRVATVSAQGIITDLSWPQVEEFCRNLGLNTAPLLWSGYAENFDVDKFMNRRYAEEWPYAEPRPVPLDPGKTVDEGVVVRVEGLTPTLLKAKASQFLEHETKQLDEGTADLESVG